MAGFEQQGNKLVGTGSAGPRPGQGRNVALSADGMTLAVGAFRDGDEELAKDAGATFVYTRDSNGTWTQQGAKLVGTGAEGIARQGKWLALSADGNSLAVGAYYDADETGATWVFTRTDGVWSQQGGKLVGVPSGGVPSAGAATNGTAAARQIMLQGTSVSMSADGSTIAVGAPGRDPPDNSTEVDDRTYKIGGAFIFTRCTGTWTQQGPQLVGAGVEGDDAGQGGTVALSADGNTLAMGGKTDGPKRRGAAWVFIRISTGEWAQQGLKLVGTGAVSGADGELQGSALAISGNGDTLAVGGRQDGDVVGAVWVYTRVHSRWGQQGCKLVAERAPAGSSFFGSTLALSYTGDTLAIGGGAFQQNTNVGVTYVSMRERSGQWVQQEGEPLLGTEGSNAAQGTSVALSHDGNVLAVGGPKDRADQVEEMGAAWVFTRSCTADNTAGCTCAYMDEVASCPNGFCVCGPYDQQAAFAALLEAERANGQTVLSGSRGLATFGQALLGGVVLAVLAM